MDKPLTFDLRGPFGLRGADGGAIVGLSRRGQAILASLALAPGWRMPRATLAGRVWSDRGDEQARASLRQELSVLRRHLPQGTLMADRDAVWLDPTLSAVNMVGEGGFLDLPEVTSPCFDDWLRDAREDLSRQWIAGRLAAGDAALAAGQAEAADAEARAALAVDDLSEEAVALILRAAARGAPRGAALQAFERFRDRLRQELDVAPAPETLALAQALKGEAAPAAAPSTAGVAAETSPDRPPSLAVMPFDEIGGDPDDMFADGIVEEITNALSRVHEFQVIARQSSCVLKGTSLDVPQQAARLGADYLVEGTIQRAKERVRISVQLVNGVDGRSLWQARFDDRLDDLFDLQDRIAAQVAGQLWPGLRYAEIERAERLPQEHRSAYAQTLSAMRHFWLHRKEENLRAIAHLDRALELSPNYAPALAYRGWALAQAPSYLWSDDPEGDRREAVACADRAAELTTDHAPSLVAIAATYSMATPDQERARRFVNRALTIDPNNAWGWMRLGWVETYSANYDACLAAIDRAEALSPLDPFRFNMVMARAGALVKSNRDPARAIELINEALALAPGMTWAYRLMVSAYIKLGKDKEAIEMLDKLMATRPGLTYAYFLESIPPGAKASTPLLYERLTELGMPEK